MERSGIGNAPAVLLQNAASIILAHNHPSGVPLPSKSDRQFTHELKIACSLMDIQLVDHIIIAKDSYYSFAQEETIKYQSYGTVKQD